MIGACFHGGGNIRLCDRDYDGGMATSIDQKNFVKTALRLPPELHAAVHESAQKNGRSYNAELVELIQRSLRPQDPTISSGGLDKGLVALQTMLAFHVRDFYNMLPQEVQNKPSNVAIRNLAFAISYGSAESIEETLTTYLRRDKGDLLFKEIAETLHTQRELLDEEIRSGSNEEVKP